MADQDTINAKVDEQFNAMQERKKALLSERESTWFSADLTLSEDEKAADAKLQKLVGKLVDENFNPCIHDFETEFPGLINSQLYKVLNAMPKGALHHIHVTAGPSADTYVKLTYDDAVYFNERDRMFKVFPQGNPHDDGFLQCTKVRKFAASEEGYDAKLKSYIQVGKEQYNKSTHSTWANFEHKFSMLADLGKYVKFFKILMKEIMLSAAKQNVYILELRHTAGRVFDDNRQAIPIVEELKMFDEILAEVKKEHPHFDIALIFCGFKIVGEAHIKKVINDYVNSTSASDKITGFDMINEEDMTPPVIDFADDILRGQETAVDYMPVYLHVGETHNARGNFNVVDSILLKSRRIGHGFEIGFKPKIIQKIKDSDMLLEVCPVSNLLLGYTRDLRNHPARFLLSQNVQISISSDDPGFFGYEGVSFDYLMAVIAWQLDLRDLKKLSLNGITYSSISQVQKDAVRKGGFDADWVKFVDYLKNLQIDE